MQKTFMEIQNAIAAHQEACNKTRQNLKEQNKIGPWITEPDRLEFKYKGLDCLLTRNPEMFNWCGYVGIPESHPHYEKEYIEVDLEAHGGITYSEACHNWVCHITDKEEDKVWWFGFDCAHSGDVIPVMPPYFFSKKPNAAEYRDLNYVKLAVEHLADQLAKSA